MREEPAPAPRLSNERKWIATRVDAARALALMDQLLAPDGAFPRNTIQSVYFDSRMLRAYGEKADGDNLKQKIRLRWYRTDAPPSGETAAFLEVKGRIGSARHKMRREWRLDHAWLETAPLTDPAWLPVVRQSLIDLGAAPQEDLVPAVSIAYERHRYRCPYTNGRVAVDWAIRVPRFHPELFPHGMPLEIHQTVCEFKDAGQVEIPWLRHLYDAGFRLRSYSKFGEAIRLLFLGGAPA